ncbi:MAG TPA: short-chain dehydrogenase [Cyanobacteria bacterium UBA8553]|nr:short-chain dehydrogenase [Cyanobacteria bacterium UBA8553]
MTLAKVAVVLGVGPGLGSAIARRFASEGFALGLMARTLEKLTPTQQAIENSGGQALSISVDATDPTSVADAFDQVRSQLGNPEVFIYNAGAFKMGGILEISPQQFEESWKTNCLGAFLGAQQVLPAMVEQGRGTILLTGATAGLRGGARFSCMAVGKFGLRALGQTLAREFGPQGIHVAHIIIDGQIDTERVRAMSPNREQHSLLAPDAIAQTYWHLYQQDAKAWTQEIDLRPSVEKF